MDHSKSLNTFHIRNFQQPDDIPRLLLLLNDTETVDHSGDDISDTAIQNNLAIANHNPEKDRWVIEHPEEQNTFIGHGAILTATDDVGQTIAEVDLVIHPRWRRQGLGSILLSAIMKRAEELGVSIVRLYANPQHMASVEFLTKHHFSPVSAYIEMRSTALKNTSLLPTGFSIVPYSTINDPSLLVTAYNSCYLNQWGHHQVTLEIIEQSLPFIDINGLFLMFAPDNTLVGMCRSEHSVQRTERNGRATGYIDAPGIIPSIRKIRLYGALLLHAADWMHKDNSIIELESWGDTQETIGFYQELGFLILRQQVAYQRLFKQKDI